ncbi:arylamine N-acetyltransferase family protein [Gordonia sp. MMO-8]
MGLWSGTDLDLPGYLRRIGFDGEPSRTLGTLERLHRLHTTSIPFENLEIILGRGIPLDLQSVQHKLVRSERGGYCFEHFVLFAAALERIGFVFTPIIGRVSLGADWSSRPATHALVVVEVSGIRYLCDVGFGRGPLVPIELRDGVETDQDGWRFRLSSDPIGDLFSTDRWTLWQHDERWIDRHVFTLAPQTPIDYRVGNHFVSTSPRSPFVARPFIQRFTPDEHHALDGDTLTTVRPDGSSASRSVPAPEVPDVLAGTFGITLTSDDAAALVEIEAARRSPSEE